MPPLFSPPRRPTSFHHFLHLFHLLLVVLPPPFLPSFIRLLLPPMGSAGESIPLGSFKTALSLLLLPSSPVPFSSFPVPLFRYMASAIRACVFVPKKTIKSLLRPTPIIWPLHVCGRPHRVMVFPLFLPSPPSIKKAPSERTRQSRFASAVGCADDEFGPAGRRGEINELCMLGRRTFVLTTVN